MKLPKRPDRLPFAPSEANVPQLEEHLQQSFATTAFNTIHLLPGAVPYARHTPIPIGKHWENDVKSQLDEDVRRGGH